jgi:hypothetical protein
MDDIDENFDTNKTNLVFIRFKTIFLFAKDKKEKTVFFPTKIFSINKNDKIKKSKKKEKYVA